jgi:AbrB family looped-hinge helix DNA binding protein
MDDIVLCILSNRVKITRAGQISVPAEVRRRWGASYLTAEDHGDHLILRPAPDDPVDAVYGIFATEAAGRPGSTEIRGQEREADAADEKDRRARR